MEEFGGVAVSARTRTGGREAQTEELLEEGLAVELVLAPRAHEFHVSLLKARLRHSSDNSFEYGEPKEMS